MKGFSIRLKIVITIFVVLLIGIGISAFFSVTNQRSSLLDTERQNLSTNNNILNTVIRNIMLDGEAPLAINTMSDLRGLPDFEQIEIYRRDGNLAFSDYSTLEFVNSYQEMIEFPSTPRLENKMNTDPVFREVVSTNTPRFDENFGEETIRYYFPILNYNDCRGCHGTDQFTRGVALYQASLTPVFMQIRETRNFLVIILLGTGVIIAVFLTLLMQGIIIRPIIRIGEVVSIVGTGNLDVRAEHRSSDELGILAEKINTMILGLKEKRRLEIDNRVIEAKNQENKKYLDNINEGLMLLSWDNTISDQYSTYLHTLFGTDTIAGRLFVDFIYPDSEKYQEERKELSEFIRMLFEKTATEMEMLMSINPLADKKLTVGEMEEAREIIVDTQFQRIYGEEGIENIMVIFEDKTDIVRIQEELRRERERSESEMEHIASILRTGPEAFLQFEDDARATLDLVRDTVSSGSAGSDIHTLIRELHSLKGSARYLEFRRISELAHQMESLFIDIRDTDAPLAGINEEKVNETMDNISSELDGIHRINDRFKEFAHVLTKEEAQQQELPDFLEQLTTMTRTIAEEQEKEINVTVDNQLTDFPWLKNMKNPIIHLTRNAIDHGIETPLERIGKRKPEEAQIQFRLQFTDNSYRISVFDDGRGIDFDKVREKAVEAGLIDADRPPADDNELLKALFSPGFSTKSEADELSGRGAGLDVVYEEVKKLGGQISVSTTPDKGTRITITLPEKGAEI